MKVLFIGDIVGKIGRRIIKEKIPYFVQKYGIDFVIANGENVTHGKGLNEHHYHELIDSGVDAITLGNHYASKSEIRRYIDKVDRLIRPLNLIEEFPGVGSEVFEVDGVLIRITNILGSAFMNDVNVNNPYYALLELLDNEDESVNIHIVDFHGEATGEKQSFAFGFDGTVSAVLGTHTHVQTADARILPNGTAFISDVGMCGFYDGILGFDKDSVVKKNLYGDNIKFSIPDEGRALFSAVVVDFDITNGKAKEIFPIYYVEGDK